MTRITLTGVRVMCSVDHMLTRWRARWRRARRLRMYYNNPALLDFEINEMARKIERNRAAALAAANTPWTMREITPTISTPVAPLDTSRAPW